VEPDRVAVSCWHDAQDTVLRSVSLVDAATGAITWTRPVHSGANGLAFSPDGGHLSIAGYAVDHIQVRILDAGSGEPVWCRASAWSCGSTGRPRDRSSASGGSPPGFGNSDAPSAGNSSEGAP
jgi:hypothetical protein